MSGDVQAHLPQGRAELARKARKFAGQVSLSLNIGRRWSRPEPQPPVPSPLERVPLNAIIATWCESDVIASTVRNAFAQGCERVFIVDNDSPDDTVAEAEAAGAEVARVYRTDFYDEARRMSEISDVMEEISRESGAPHVWWLIFDADEFPHGPAGLTIADYASGLDRRFRVVGARVFDHFPSGEPAHVPGRHPLDYQPLCQEMRIAWCSLRHWKHPLIRWDRDGIAIKPARGFHRVESARPVLEPTEGLYLHHFQYRERDATFERLRKLCEDRGDGVVRSALDDTRQGRQSGARRRYATLEYVYAGDWDRVEQPTVRDWRQGVRPRPWTEQVPAADAVVARWYTEELSNADES